MEITVEHFVDASEQDPDGRYDYYYEGDHYTFAEGAATLRARTYVDTPAQAAFLERRATLETSPLTARAVAYFAERGATKVLVLERGFEEWSIVGPDSA